MTLAEDIAARIMQAIKNEAEAEMVGREGEEYLRIDWCRSEAIIAAILAEVITCPTTETTDATKTN